MEAFEALKEDNDFGPATYWNRPTSGRMPRESKYASLQKRVTRRKGKPTPPPGSRTISPAPSHVSKHTSLGGSVVKHTSTAEENDVKDEKAIQKLMKSKLPLFSDE
jgi:hypothetical protein